VARPRGVAFLPSDSCLRLSAKRNCEFHLKAEFEITHYILSFPHDMALLHLL